jgi:hypothetical protein
MKKNKIKSFKATFHNANFTRHSLCILLFWFSFFLALPTKASEDIVFKFIIEYSSLTDFGPHVVGFFYVKIFEK